MGSGLKGVVPDKLGNPSDGTFNYPINRSRNRKNVDVMRKAEVNLDKFWNLVDSGMKRKMGEEEFETICRMFADCGTMRRTGPWVEPLPQAASTKDISKDNGDDHVPLSRVFHDRTHDITGNFDRLNIQERSKTKTRGVPGTNSQSESEQAHPKPTSQPLYHVNKGSFFVFRSLFHTQEQGEIPGKIRWEHFVNALVKLGFSAEKLHGSAWQSTPKKIKLPEDMKRGIQFHEPHPGGDIPFVLARRFGRRLTRAYGWCGEMFKMK
jgi:hypothetical protein